MPTGVMMYSVCVNNPEVDIDFHLVVGESVTIDDKKDLTETVAAFEGKQVAFYDFNSPRCAPFPLRLLPSSTYYRLFLSEMLPENIDKVLYLDGDCIVRHSLLPLWNNNLEDCAVGAVFCRIEGNKEIYERLQYPADNGYFNAGVLLINLDYWRNNDVVKTFVSYISAFPDRIKYEDQDVLNAIFHDKRKALHVKYNLQTGCLCKDPLWDSWNRKNEVVEAILDPVIIHYTWMSKPWEAYSRHPHPFRSSFLKYQNKTKWKGYRCEKRNHRTVIRNFIGDSLRKMGVLSPLPSPFMEIFPVD